MPSSISTDEWLAELVRLSARTDDGMTSVEWSDRLGVSENTFHKWLKSAQRKGWKVVVGWRTTARIDGRRSQTPVYQVMKPKK